MQGHTRIYFEALGLSKGDAVHCEIPKCNQRANDIHHIDSRGMGGTSNPFKNSIFNLMAVCRSCHDKYGDKAKFLIWLKEIHFRFLLRNATRIMGVFRETNYKEDGSIEIR